MRHRSHHPPITQQPSWPRRRPNLVPAAIISGVLLLSTGLVLSIEIQVRVPLLVPLAGALSTGLLARLLLVRSVRRHQQQAAAVEPTGMSVAIALSGDLDGFIGRAERDAVFALLAERYATEHLDEDDYGTRHTQVLNAKRRRDLRPALEGLTW